MACSIPPDDVKPDSRWLMPDKLWKVIEPLLPQEENKGKGTKGGRPNVDLRRTMDAIIYILRTGCHWKAIPRCLGSGSTAHLYFQKWCAAGVFEKFWRLGLNQYNTLKGIQWKWQAMDATMSKSPLAVRR